MQTRLSVAAVLGCGGRDEVHSPSRLNPRIAQTQRFGRVQTPYGCARARGEKLWTDRFLGATKTNWRPKAASHRTEVGLGEALHAWAMYFLTVYISRPSTEPSWP